MCVQSDTPNLSEKITRTILIVVMNLVLWPLIAAWTILGMVLFPFGFLLMALIKRSGIADLTRQSIWIYGRGWSFLFSLFVKFEKLDADIEKFKTPGIIVVNHRSFFDTYCMNLLPVYDVCFAVRAWPFRIYFYRLFMEAAGYMNIESDAWEKVTQTAQKNFDAKSFVLFFPEGHRSRTQELTHFYSGAFKLAVENKVPVIPICLTGTGELLPPGRKYLAPAHIKLKVMDPVFPDKFEGEMSHIQLKNHVRKIMDDQIRAMET